MYRNGRQFNSVCGAAESGLPRSLSAPAFLSFLHCLSQIKLKKVKTIILKKNYKRNSFHMVIICQPNQNKKINIKDDL